MSDRLRQQFSVAYEYDVHFVDDMFEPERSLLSRLQRRMGHVRPRMLVVFDDGVWQSHKQIGKQLERYCTIWEIEVPEVIVVPGGEAAKSEHDVVDRIVTAIDVHAICRHSCLLAVGGGAVLDAVGFAASIAHRGVRLIRAPTTVLSQADGGVGVKNGINAYGKKNFVGTFAVPAAVINDSHFLPTLSIRDWRAGIAEAVKVALIRDAHFFAEIEHYAAALAARDMNSMKMLIRRCAELHLRHISQGGDPFERGSARPLDFGHWSAHRLESLSHYRLRHGEAVAIGVALESLYSMLQGLLSRAEAERILIVLETLGFKLFVPELEDDSLFLGIHHFREHLGGELTVTLLTGIGQALDVHVLEEAQYRSAISILKRRQGIAPTSAFIHAA